MVALWRHYGAVMAAPGHGAVMVALTNTHPSVEDGQDKDCVTYEQFAESIKKNMSLTNETDSLQVT